MKLLWHCRNTIRQFCDILSLIKWYTVSVNLVNHISVLCDWRLFIFFSLYLLISFSLCVLISISLMIIIDRNSRYGFLAWFLNFKGIWYYDSDLSDIKIPHATLKWIGWSLVILLQGRVWKWKLLLLCQILNRRLFG